MLPEVNMMEIQLNINIQNITEAIYKLIEGIVHPAVKYFNICAFTYPFVAIGMLTCRAMQGMNKPTPFLFLTLLRILAHSSKLKSFCFPMLYQGWSTEAYSSISSDIWNFKISRCQH